MRTAAFLELFHRPGCARGPKNAQRISQAAQRALLPPQPQPEVHLRRFDRELKRVDLSQQAIAELTTQLADWVRHTPARQVACIPGAAAALVAHVLAAIDEWHRVPSVRELWATAGFAPSPLHAGTAVPATPKVSTSGCPHLRPASSLLTTALVWHEPTVGIPCFQRLLQGKPCVPTIIPIGRKVANTALAILTMAQPVRPRWAEPQAAKARLQHVQDRYLASTHTDAKAGAAMPQGGSPPP